MEMEAMTKSACRDFKPSEAAATFPQLNLVAVLHCQDFVSFVVLKSLENSVLFLGVVSVLVWACFEQC